MILDPFAALVAAVIVTIPGLAVASLARLRNSGISGAAAIGCAVVSLVAYGCGQLGLGLGAIAILVVLIVVAAVLVLIRVARQTLGDALDLHDGLPIAVGWFAAIVASSQGTWLSHTADSFYHLAAIRSLWLRGEAFPRLPMYSGDANSLDPTGSGLHTIAAVALSLTGADTLGTWDLLHPLAAALIAASFTRLLLRLVPESPAMVIAGLCLWIASEGMFDLRETIYPHAIALATLWTLAGLVIVDHYELTWRRAVLIGAGLAGLAAIHIGLAIVGVIVIGLALVRRPLLLGATLSPGILVLIARLSPLTAMPSDPRVGFPAYPSAIPSFGAPATYAWAEIAAGRFVALSSLTVVAVAIAVGALFVWVRQRRAPLAWPIVAIATIPALGLLAPFAETWPAIAYAAMRIAIPAATFQAAAMVIVFAELARSRPPIRSIADVLAFALTAAAVLTSIGPLRGLLDTRAEGRGLSASRTASPRADLIAITSGMRLSGRTIIADPVTSYYLTGLADVQVATTPRNHTPAAIERTDGWLRRADVTALVNASAAPERLAAIAARWPDSPIMIDASLPGAARWAARALPGFRASVTLGDLLMFTRTQAAPREWMNPALDRDGGAWGYLPAEPLAGDALFIGVKASPDIGRSIELIDAMGLVIVSGEIVDDAAMLVPPATTPAGWYRVIINTDGGRRQLGRLSLGNEYEAESFPVRDRPPRGVSYSGWRIYDLDYYGRGRAAITGYDGTMMRSILPIPPGRYRIVARVYDYPESAENAATVAFGDARATLRWMGGTNGPTIVSTEAVSGVPISSVAITAARVDQPFAIIDWIRVFPVDDTA